MRVGDSVKLLVCDWLGVTAPLELCVRLGDSDCVCVVLAVDVNDGVLVTLDVAVLLGVLVPLPVPLRVLLRLLVCVWVSDGDPL